MIRLNMLSALVSEPANRFSRLYLYFGLLIPFSKRALSLLCVQECVFLTPLYVLGFVGGACFFRCFLGLALFSSGFRVLSDTVLVLF